MTSQAPQPHFVLFPLMAQGHMIPMVDIGRILAKHNVIVTIVTTPHNASRIKPILARSAEFGFQIRLVQLQFPCKEVGLPDGCENFDMLPSMGMAARLFNATSILQQPAEKLFEELTPRPSCIISDMCLPYTADLAKKFNIPRISFVGVSCFCLLCMRNIHKYNALESISTESEYFVLPGIPDKIEMTRAQIDVAPNDIFCKEFKDKMHAAEIGAYGIIMNSFDELEPAYSRDYKKARNNKVWCIGPVSLANKDHLDKAQRGNKASIDENQCLKWLDKQKSRTVIYACLGSGCNLTPLQLIELGLALEESNMPFIWVIREGTHLKELDKWITDNGLEDRTKGRGLLIRGWAPQILILSHPAVGGFITHCGWNSTLEGISAGAPMITWPLFADQFFNAKLVSQVLGIGVSLKVEVPMKFGDEENIGVQVTKEDIKNAICTVMDEGEEGEERRRKASLLGEMAKRAVEEGGSSHLNTTLFIQDIMQKANEENKLVNRE